MKPILFCLLVLWSAITATAQPGRWQGMPFNVQQLANSFDRSPRCFYEDTAEHALYIGGLFAVNGSARLIRWDGTSYTVLPTPLTEIYCIIRFQNELYVGGPEGVYRASGSGWTTITDKGVFRMYPYAGKLIMAAIYSNLFPTVPGPAAFYDGAVFSTLYRVDTVSKNLGGCVLGIAERNGELYLAGQFNYGGSLRNIMRFDGTHWKAVGDWVKGAVIYDLTEWNGALYAGGQFRQSKGAPGDAVAKWDGQQWSPLRNGIGQDSNQMVVALKVYHNRLYAAGYFATADGFPAAGIAHWDGSRWCRIHDSTNSTFVALGTFEDTLYVGGYFSQIDGDTGLSNIAKWAGGNYTSFCGNSGLDVPAVPSAAGEPVLYPNPCNDQVTITGEDLAAVTLLDMTGKRLITQTITGDKALLRVGTLPPGVYGVMIRHWSGRRSVRRLVRQ